MGVERRINAVVSEEVYLTLKNIAEEEGITMTEILRRGISLVKWIHEATRDNAKVIVKRGGNEFEVNLW